MSKEKEPNQAAEAAEEVKQAKKAEKAEKAEKLKAQLKEAEARAEKAENELAAQMDKYLRVVAEYDNFRKRSQKEREALYSDAFSDAATAFLPLIDNIERAVVYANDDSELAKGVLMLEKQTKNILEKMKIEEIASTGEQFDPNLHNAIFHEEDDTKPENTVTETLQKGYRLGDKVIRHALVTVVN